MSVKRFSYLMGVAFLVLMLIFPPSLISAGGWGTLNLPKPGTMLYLSDPFVPFLLKGISVDVNEPLKFNLLIDVGNEKDKSKEWVKQQSEYLIKYFLTALTVPEKDLWVNLSPYEKDRIIPKGFGGTEMGKDLLAQDYILKQLSASLMHPEGELGKTFWKDIKSAFKEEGQDFTIDLFNKVWIVPGEVLVFENETSGYIVKSSLKVMMEEDYLMTKSGKNKIDGGREVNKMSRDLMNRKIIPIIEKEVNEGRNFAQLRQIYNALILAKWYKQRIENVSLEKSYMGKGKFEGVNTEDKDLYKKVYNQYVDSYEQGSFNYIREEYDEGLQEIIPRRYFSGGFQFFIGEGVMDITTNPSVLSVSTKKDPSYLNLDFSVMLAVPDPSSLAEVIKGKESKEIKFPGGNVVEISDPNQMKLFSGFLSGVAGELGVPMWVFYTNRRQWISAFGTKSKDDPILDYRTISEVFQDPLSDGFRTFIKIKDVNGNRSNYEPFQNGIMDKKDKNVKTKIYITLHGLTLKEVNKTLGITVEVEYSTLPYSGFSGLVRKMTIINNSNSVRTFEVIDGLANIVPAGVTNSKLNVVSNTIQAVYKTTHFRNGIMYHIHQEYQDVPKVDLVKERHFILSVDEDQNYISNPESVFGNTSLLFPNTFFGYKFGKFLNSAKVSKKEGGPVSAMIYKKKKLGSKETFTITSVFGKGSNKDHVITIVDKIKSQGNYFKVKEENNLELMKKLVAPMNINTNSGKLNQYIIQTFLDNLLRGGKPYQLFSFSDIKIDLEKDIEMVVNNMELNMEPDMESYNDVNKTMTDDILKIIVDLVRRDKIYGDVGKNIIEESVNGIQGIMLNMDLLDDIKKIIEKSLKNKMIYTYGRKHGDIERDYNMFFLEPEFFSQGNGNFRDIGQNVRNDIEFEPHLKEYLIKKYLNLIQADGYNPLVVDPVVFKITDKERDKLFDRYGVDRNTNKVLINFLSQSFSPGGLIKFLLDNKDGIQLNDELLVGTDTIKDIQEQKEFKIHNFFKVILFNSDMEQRIGKSEHGEGFWTDHWDYLLDLIEMYQKIYPKGLRKLLLDGNMFTFYLNSNYIKPMKGGRYGLKDNEVKEVSFIVDGQKEINGGGSLETNKEKEFSVNGMSKILSIIANKISTLDPKGLGVRMEAEKPGWNDALNGLPALTGSSIAETFELRRLALFLLDAMEKLNLKDSDNVLVYEELSKFFQDLRNILSSKMTDFEYWKKSTTIKEEYRESVRSSVTGDFENLTVKDIREFLNLVVEKTRVSEKMAFDKDGKLSTYFTFGVTKYEPLNDITLFSGEEDIPAVVPTEFSDANRLPEFLEGYVRLMSALATEKTLMEKKRDRLDRTSSEEKEILTKKINTISQRLKEIYDTVRNSGLYDKKLKMYRLNTSLKDQSDYIGRVKHFSPGYYENESIFVHMYYKFLLVTLQSGLYEEFYEEFKQFVPFLDPDVYGNILFNVSNIISSANFDEDKHGNGRLPRLSGATAEVLSMIFLMSFGGKWFEVNKEGQLTLTFDPKIHEALFTTKETKMKLLRRAGDWEDITLPEDTYSANLFSGTLIVYHNPERMNTYDEDSKIKKITLHFEDGSKKSVTIEGSVIPEQYASMVLLKEVRRIDLILERNVDSAVNVEENNGGVDLGAIDIKKASRIKVGSLRGELFSRNLSGIVPTNINIIPLRSVSGFLGLDR